MRARLIDRGDAALATRCVVGLIEVGWIGHAGVRLVTDTESLDISATLNASGWVPPCSRAYRQQEISRACAPERVRLSLAVLTVVVELEHETVRARKAHKLKLSRGDAPERHAGRCYQLTFGGECSHSRHGHRGGDGNHGRLVDPGESAVKARQDWLTRRNAGN